MKKLLLLIAVIISAITASAEVPDAQYANEAPKMIYWFMTDASVNISDVFASGEIPSDATPVTHTSTSGMITTTGRFFALVPNSIADITTISYSYLSFPGYELYMKIMDKEYVPGYKTCFLNCGVNQYQFNFRIRDENDVPHFNIPIQDQFLTLGEMENEVQVSGDNFTNFTAKSSNPDVATVTVSGNNVKTTFHQMTSQLQEVTVTVTATTSYGKTGTHSYKVTQSGYPKCYWATSLNKVEFSDYAPSELHPITYNLNSGKPVEANGILCVFVPKEIDEIVTIQSQGVLGISGISHKLETGDYYLYYLLVQGSPAFVAIHVTYNTSALTANNFSLVDGQPYTLNESVENANITYTRTFANTDWQPLYVPFSMSYADWSRLGAVAELTGAGDGVLEWTTLEEGSQTVAGRPYIFKPNAAGTAAFVVNDATLVGCGTASPVAYGGYTLSGTYEEKDDMESLYVLSDGNFSKASADEALQPYRIYIEAPAGAPSQLRMRINGAEEAALQGDMDGDGKITMSYGAQNEAYNVEGGRKTPKAVYLQRVAMVEAMRSAQNEMFT